jgi:hypothetical protein
MNNQKIQKVFQAATPNNGTPFYYHPSVRHLAAARAMNLRPYSQKV